MVPHVDVFAPGLNIQSAYIGSDETAATISGTAQAAAHGAGIIAYFLSLLPANAITPKALKKSIIELASSDKLSDVPSDTPNVSSVTAASDSLTSI